MSKAIKKVIAEFLGEEAKTNKDIVVLCSDSRGSAALGPYAEEHPEQFVEVGIAEQNLVGISAGLAAGGKRPFAVSPARFLSTRSMEQAKVDVAYSHMNVKLLGISGGVSYGALGMTHHSATDIATMGSIPGLRVYFPSDQYLAVALMKELVKDQDPAYIRIGRNAVEDVYGEDSLRFEMDKAVTVQDGTELTIIACGETVYQAKKAAEMLAAEGKSVRVLDMYCLKPLDKEAIRKAAQETRAILTVEEHSPYGGLGAMVAQLTAEENPVKVRSLTLPDAPIVTGETKDIFHHYGLDAEGIAKAAREML